jgi:hypothetical protein
MNHKCEYSLNTFSASIDIPCDARIGETHAGIPSYTVSLSSLVDNAGTIVLECSTKPALSTPHDHEPFVSLRAVGRPVKSGNCAFLLQTILMVMN